MPETENGQKRSLSKELTTSLNKDGRFVYYPEMDYRVNKGDSHRVSQFDFFDIRWMIQISVFVWLWSCRRCICSGMQRAT